MRVNDITKQTIIEIGHVGEKGFRDVAFNVSEWIAKNPSATIHLAVLRYKDTVPYPVELELNGSTAIWHITNVDTAVNGKGKAQLILTDGETVIGKSHVFQVVNRYALDDTGEVPDAYNEWFEKLTNLADKVHADYEAVRVIKGQMELELDKIEERTDAEVAQYLAAHRDELKGDPGKDGDDYILTESDKAEISGMAAEGIQPEIDELKSSVSESVMEISKPKVIGDDTDYGLVYTTSKSINLINKSKLKRGYYINNGNILPSNDWCVTDKIYVNAGEKVYAYLMQITCFFKADNTFISQVVGAGNFTVPNETAYLISCVTVANSERCYMSYRQGLSEDGMDNGVITITKKDYEAGFIPFTVPVRQTKSNNVVGASAHSEGEEDYVNVDCILSLPAYYTSYGKPCKLLMMCHGAGQGATSWKDHEGYKALVQNFLGRGYAVFDCNGFKNDALGWSFWGDSRGVDAWRKAYQYVVNNYNVEHEFSIYGFSMGGLTAMNLAFSGFPNIKCIGLGSPVLSLEACYNDSGAGNVVKLLYDMGDTYEPSKAYGSNPWARVVTSPPTLETLTDKNNVIHGFYVKPNGEKATASDWNVTGYIDVNPNEQLTINGYGITCFYKEDKSFISYVQNVGSTVVPENARYMRSCITDGYKDVGYIKVTRSNKYVYGILPPIKIWYGSTETGSGTDTGTDLTVGGAVNKNIAREFVQAINNGGGMAEYREVAGAGHEICYGMNNACNIDYLLYFERHNKFVDRNTL